MKIVKKLKTGIIKSLVSVSRKLSHRHLTGEDEGFHTYGDDYYWNESYYFNFNFPEHDISGFTRIGILPNQNLAVLGLALYMNGGVLLFREDVEISSGHKSLSFHSLSYKLEEPMKKWQITLNGTGIWFDNPMELLSTDPFQSRFSFKNIKLNLIFNAISPVHDYRLFDAEYFSEQVVEKNIPLSELKRLKKVASFHYEQVGEYHGRIQVDSENLNVIGSGHRDHSWGVRDWKIPSLWRWFTCQFKDGTAFNLSRVIIGKVDIINGFVYRDGNNYPVRKCSIEEKFLDEDNIFQKEFQLRITDCGGSYMYIKGKVKSLLPIIIPDNGHTTLVNEAIARFEKENGSTGEGIAEYLLQLDQQLIKKLIKNS